MSSGATFRYPGYSIPVAAMSPECPTDRAACAVVGSYAYASAVASSAHRSNYAMRLSESETGPFRRMTFVHRMPERQLSRGPFVLCTVAVLEPQEGR